MSSHQIEVLISPTGETRITTKGFHGPKCREATKDLEAALGLKLAETLTAEYHFDAAQETRCAEHPNASH